jgi:Tfp pilus assembly protein PilN
LPGDVRITAVQPQIDRQGRFLLAINVMARSVEAVDSFIGEMEKSGAFQNALAVQETLQPDNLFRTVIQTYYRPEAVTPDPTSESSEKSQQSENDGQDQKKDEKQDQKQDQNDVKSEKGAAVAATGGGPR